MITPIQPNDRLRESREVINNNFNSLNVSKANRTEIQGSALTYATTTGTGNDFVVSLTPAPTAYTAGLTINFRANRNNTGASTLNVNNLGVKTIRKNGTENLIAGDIIQGAIYTVIFDGDFFQIVSGATADVVRTFGDQVIFGNKEFRGDISGTETRQFTYGETIAVNDAVYLRASDGLVMRTNASFSDERVYNFIGFAKEAGGLNDVRRVQISGVVDGFSGLTPGRDYFLGNTPGGISLIRQGSILQIGIAINTIQLLIRKSNIVFSSNEYIIAGEGLKNSNDTQNGMSGTTWTRIKEVRLNAPLPNCRIRFDTQLSGGAGGGWAIIRRNGINIGTEQASFHGAWITYTQDFSGFNTNDLIQVWGAGTNSAINIFVRNFRFFYRTATRVQQFIGGYEDVISDIVVSRLGEPISMTNLL